MNAEFRKVLNPRVQFPTDDAALKVIFLALQRKKNPRHGPKGMGRRALPFLPSIPRPFPRRLNASYTEILPVCPPACRSRPKARAPPSVAMVTPRPAQAGAMAHSLRAQDLPYKHAAIARRPRALMPTRPCFGPSVPLQADTAALRSRPRTVVPPIATSASAPILTRSASEFIPPSRMGHSTLASRSGFRMLGGGSFARSL